MDAADSVHPLRRWRKDNGKTGEALGALIGVSKFAVSDYENGKRRPGRAVEKKIAEVTGITPADLEAAYDALQVEAAE